ncbi:MAG: flagellar biosynthesis protein FlhB [Clostridiales bacterium]|jgi:flagellar biosynthesis protein|nr:flagellar biosynthesis protein FlhB [Clostridiales bacterium]
MEKNKKVAAIKYELEDSAPKVIAKGTGFVAEKILIEAGKADIPVYKDAALVESLTKIELGDNIPQELYEVVAEILVFVDDMDKLYRKLNVK